MKKTISVLIMCSMILATCSGSVFASETQEAGDNGSIPQSVQDVMSSVVDSDSSDVEETNVLSTEGITFRGIPWGTSISTFLEDQYHNPYSSWWGGDAKIPKDGDYDTKVSSIYSIAYYLSCPYEVDYISYDTYSAAPGRVIEWWTWDEGELTVAGYDISETDLYFMQPVNEDGSVDHTPENAYLYMAQYTIENSLDVISDFNDLTEKLNNLYGDYSYELFDSQVIRMWTDENNNSVSLVRYDSSYEINCIEIVYTSGTAMDDIQNLDTALYNEQTVIDNNQRQENSNNVDGL